jgi:hypothetical protein
MIAAIMSKLGLRIVGALAIAIAVLGVILKIRNSGRIAERVETQQRILKQVDERHEIEREVFRNGGDAARERLYDKWSRD